MENLVVFNDPDDDEYEEEDEMTGAYYLGDELNANYWIFKAIAKGDVSTYLRLYYETSRVDVIRMLAYTVTYSKERKLMERKINGR